jgi:uncharacterized protein
VKVFPLKVLRQSDQWPEPRQRKTRWLPIKEAAQAVQEPMLSRIIRRFPRKSAT